MGRTHALPIVWPWLEARELDAEGQPTSNVIESRRPTRFITPIPRPKKQPNAGGHARFSDVDVPRTGFIIPSMGTKSRTKPRASSPGPGLADALFAKVQQRVLGVLFGNPHRSFYANEVIALARSGTGAVQRELMRLEASGLVTAHRVGKQKHYQANAASPVFTELRALILKTVGLMDVLRAALAPVSKSIRAAFVYGSIAKGEDTATSDIDLMLVSERLTYADLFATLEDASAQLGRKVAPTIYSPKELARRIKQDNAFVTRVMAQPKLWLVGSESDLAA